MENNDLKDYLLQEWNRSVHAKYRQLFKHWFANLTDVQITYFEAHMKGQKTPWIKM